MSHTFTEEPNVNSAMNTIITPDERTRLSRILRLPLQRKLRLAWNLRRDPRVSRAMMLPLIAVAGYLILPVHVLPHWIPFRGRIDDLLLGALGLWIFIKVMPGDLLDQHLERVDQPH